MSKTKLLKKSDDKDVIRCNLRVSKYIHTDIYSHLSTVPDKGRAEECRYLMRLGLMFVNGASIDNGTRMLNINDGNSVIETQKNKIKADTLDPTENKTNTPKTKNKVGNFIDMGDSDLDLGDELLLLG